MHTRILSTTLLICFFTSISSCSPKSEKNQQAAKPDQRSITASHEKSDKKIQVALLLDTSNSMDGLIEQAKARLWNVVNTLTTLRYDGKIPTIEIALYEYGNTGLSPTNGYVRKIVPLTNDLDLISEQLFALTTNGGDEYCGLVIQDAANTLEWGHGEDDMRLIYIAGNEEFNQGHFTFNNAIGNAREKDIYINTIFCGDRTEGMLTFWEEGAKCGKGSYFNINQDVMIEEMATPYDEKIAQLNYQLNETYVSYGRDGNEKKSNQQLQDKNAESVSFASATERTISKSNAVYSNKSWDLVDKMKEDKEVLKSISKEELPSELRDKSTKQIERFIALKSKKREAIQRKITELARKRQTYIDEHSKKDGDAYDLGKAIQRSVIKLAKSKGYTVAA
jgi:hypothetical protein